MLNIVIPMAGLGSRFKEAGYAFPKPLISIHEHPMIEVVIKNLKPTIDHRFIFICQRAHFEKYDLYNIFKNATENKFEVIQLNGLTEGAACTVLSAIKYIDSEEDLLIANSDQYVQINMDAFIQNGRTPEKDGLILTFETSHPKWSFVRLDETGKVIEVAEKKVISHEATVGIYYFAHGKDFVRGAQNMIHKNIRCNNEFYVCPVYNELILEDKNIYTQKIKTSCMHGLGTPEDLQIFLKKLENNTISIL